MLTAGSLFAGIGLLDRGLERAGLVSHVAWQAEIDPYCRAVLTRHYPKTRRFNDVREVTRDAADRVDVVCGGFPCQPISCAGKQLGDADPRWLWPEYARIVGELQPAIVVAENVPPLRSRGLRGVLADLAALGFDAEWTCFRAGDIGAPHERDRIWIVATHPDRVRVRHEPGWLGRACWEAARVASDSRAAWPLADADQERRDEGGRPVPSWQSVPAGRGGREAAPVDATDAHRQGQPQPEGSFGELRGWARDSGWRHPPPAIRGVDDGLPDGLDLRCDAAGGCRGEACDHELAPDSFRVAGLGNAVVEQCAELVGRATVSAIGAQPGDRPGDRNGAK